VLYESSARATSGGLEIVESNGLSGHLHCIVFLTESGERQMAKPRLLSDAVVEDLNLFGDLALSLLTVAKRR
jgi:hypothetical protein